MTLQELCARLLPPDEHLLVETLLMEESGISLVLSATAPKAICPACLHPACRVHGRYLRTLADLPWATTRAHPKCDERTGRSRLGLKPLFQISRQKGLKDNSEQPAAA